RSGLVTDYLSDEWFDCIRACVDEARKLGMEAWSYDENGWPSGFAGGELLKDKKNFALSIEHKDGAFPEIGEDIYETGSVIAVYKKNADGSFTLITEDCGEENYLILYRRFDESYVDTLDSAITDKFIEATHAEYKRRLSADDFGTAMPGFFTDEPQYYRWGHPYSNTLPAEFEKAYGCSIFEHLPAIFFDFDGADTFRYRYYYLIHKLFINNFIKKIYDWCNENGCGITGHAVEESSLGGQMMCVGGCMPFYEYETIPGVDYLGRGIQDDISFKQLGSACAQLGKKKALSEMFACCGWDVSPAELKRIAEVQYAGGVNVMCQHLYPYSERGQRKRDYPQHYSEHNPWDAYTTEFNLYFNNLGAALAQGQEYAPVLVIHPIHGAYCKYKKDDHRSLSEIEGKFFELSRLLGHNQIPYHYGDEWMMQRMASVENGKITVGQCTYDTVIIPFTYSLDASTAALLKDFIAQGGKIWLFDRKPDCIDGVPADCSWLEANMTREELFGVRRTVITKNGKGVPQLRHMTRLTDDGILVYITNITPNTLEDVHVQLPETGFPWAKLNLYTMELEPVYIADGTAVLSFTDSASFVLVSGQDIDCAPLTEKPALPRTFIPVPKTVKLAAHPTNVLTLDTASRSNDGITYDEPLSVMGIKDNLLREQYSGKVFLKFTFTLEYQPKTLKAVLEPMYERVTVNGTEITPDKNDWWFDKSFASAEISHLTHEGVNEIIVQVNHYQRDYVYYVLYSGVSESLRNCLVFDTEIENMYLIGDFSVRCDGSFTERERNADVFDGTFTLTAQPSVVPAENIVRGGFPFFCGRIETAFTYSYTAGKPTVLKLDGRFATAEIAVNGQKAGTMLFERTLDLAPLLTEGDNEITVILSNSMRNTMGPHHRHDPEPYGVGPGTFSFEKEWRGRECRGYVPSYAFVKYGMKKA
ncbi:MAG: hypothetical protein IJB20_02205, partial [Clostridia bacterium]|nr:hypothetical protein [Clostridia bacterium]